QMKYGAEALQRRQPDGFERRKRRRIEQTRSGRAKKSDDERAHQSFDHQAQVRVARIKIDGVPDKQWPESNANRAKQQTKGKENPKRFARGQRKKTLRLHVNPRTDNYSSRQKWTIQPPPSCRSTCDRKPSLLSLSINGDGRNGAITERPSSSPRVSIRSRMVE